MRFPPPDLFAAIERGDEETIRRALEDRDYDPRRNFVEAFFRAQSLENNSLGMLVNNLPADHAEDLVVHFMKEQYSLKHDQVLTSLCVVGKFWHSNIPYFFSLARVYNQLDYAYSFVRFYYDGINFRDLAVLYTPDLEIARKAVDDRDVKLTEKNVSDLVYVVTRAETEGIKMQEFVEKLLLHWTSLISTATLEELFAWTVQFGTAGTFMDLERATDKTFFDDAQITTMMTFAVHQGNIGMLKAMIRSKKMQLSRSFAMDKRQLAVAIAESSERADVAEALE